MNSSRPAVDTLPEPTPFSDGLAMPARFDKHARTLVTWPPQEESVGTDVAGFRKEIEQTVHAIARFEPVTLLVDPKDESDARERCGDVAEIHTVRGQDNAVAGVHFGFNGWGGRIACPRTQAMPSRAVAHLGMRCYQTSFICEGGGISIDGEGTLITTEQVMLNPNRYTGMSREDIEQQLQDYLGIERVIWLELGLVEDTETDGHVDNVVEFVAPGTVLVQTVDDTSNPNYELLRDNLKRLTAARDARGRKLDIVEMNVLPYATAPDGRPLVIPYTNAYVVNGAVIAPEVDPAKDDLGFKILEQAFPSRTVVPVPSYWQAVGGGGLGCVTQQVPFGKPATLIE
jgi:agmatine deiminase